MTTDQKITNLQEQFDFLALAHADALEELRATKVRLAILERKVVPARLTPDVAEFATFHLGTDNAPARRHFDSTAFMSLIGERQRA